MMEWLPGALAPVGYIVLRRLPYLACYGYGSILAAQQGVTLERQAAYEMGRTAILQNTANAAVTAWRSADWPKVWAGLMHWRGEAHEFFADLWRGAARDATMAWLWCVHRLPEKPAPARTETDQTIALLHEANIVAASETPMAPDAAVAASGLAWDLERQRVALLADMKDQSKPSTLETFLQHRSVCDALRTVYADDPATAAAMSTQRGLLSQANALGTFAALNPARLYVMGAAAVFAIGGWAWGWERNNRVTHVVMERNEARAHIETMRKNRDDWKNYGLWNAGELAKANEQTKGTAETIKAERARIAAAQDKERRRQNAIRDVLSGSGPAPNWGLRDAGPQASATDGGGAAKPAAETRNPG